MLQPDRELRESEENMRARRVGNEPEFRLFQHDREIGFVDGTRVAFQGFASRDDAALAASVAHRALARRRGQPQHSMDEPKDFVVVNQGSTQSVIPRTAVSATLLPPALEDSESGGWGFEIMLLPEENVEVFAVARARVIWRALQGSGIYRRMNQFRAERRATV
jgi:hypothetical protein